ncbi:hypothetical protein CPLU01_06503 [Colletotrichum plurivorum]|uniref:Uncharacterized protein n=1 Tax=Colletotrichum plurivorum TaxID=2175906 RepID=A0A8H6KHZ9_9PEZI|nr:hypothetical protein CPLU01_06503 [Colletotrichum plurivorum]
MTTVAALVSRFATGWDGTGDGRQGVNRAAHLEAVSLPLRLQSFAAAASAVRRTPSLFVLRYLAGRGLHCHVEAGGYWERLGAMSRTLFFTLSWRLSSPYPSSSARREREWERLEMALRTVAVCVAAQSWWSLNPISSWAPSRRHAMRCDAMFILHREAPQMRQTGCAAAVAAATGRPLAVASVLAAANTVVARWGLGTQTGATQLAYGAVLRCAALGFCRDDRRFPARFGFDESGGGERAEADGIHQSNSATPVRLFAPPIDPPYSAQSQTERRAGWNATAHGDAQRPEMIEAAGGRGSGKESCDDVGSSRAFRVQCADFGSGLPRAQFVLGRGVCDRLSPGWMTLDDDMIDGTEWDDMMCDVSKPGGGRLRDVVVVSKNQSEERARREQPPVR